LLNLKFFGTDGKADDSKISALIKEIEVGIWDNYLFWEYEAYQNVMAQKDLAITVASQLPAAFNQFGVNTMSKKTGSRK
jgi:hypothetical protein